AALRERAREIAEAQESETGRAADDALDGVLAGARTLVQYAELGPVHRGRSLHGAPNATDLMLPRPRGVVLALTPWNDPVPIACGLLGAALVTGNTVVHKPSERCPRTGALLGEILADAVGADVARTVSGDGRVGAALAATPGFDVVAHVGGTATGREIAAAAASTGARTLLENGGNDPLLVDGDVPPAWAAHQAAIGAFANAGQICTSVERIYVHAAVAEPFLEALTDEALARPSLTLVDRVHRDGVHAQVAAAMEDGAHLVTGGVVRDLDGPTYQATVLTHCTPDMAVFAEETFGPVAPIRVVDDFDQGLHEAASGPYGLAATVLTRSMAHAQQAWARLPVGTVKINNVFGGAPGGSSEPRGASGHGVGFGPELLDEMTTWSVLHMEAVPEDLS
ncbi:MAG: aldehyde dehydrogenase family protein, partial [Actinomycetota bacterium]|nr:aldehyde dehydrogenase family protein [Actinomycetota bacterium]